MGKARQITLTERDRQILVSLARRVRVFSIEQIARTWWDGSRRAALARLRVLEEARLIQSSTALVHPELTLDSPVVSWRPSKAPPSFQIVSSRLRSRWTKGIEPQTVFVLERQAASAFGGLSTPARRTDELTHDLHVSAVYLRYRARRPELAAGWVGERVIKKTRLSKRGALPDAMIRAAAFVRFIEFGGAYSTKRVQTFHDFCAQSKSAYELW